MFNFEVDEKRFEILKEQYLRGLKNFSAEQPYQLAIYYLAVILTEQAWTKSELIDAMSCKWFDISNFDSCTDVYPKFCEVVTIERLRHFIKEVMSRMHAECFIYGNVNREKALQMSNLVENQLKKTNSFILPQLSRQLLLKREYKLTESKFDFKLTFTSHFIIFFKMSRSFSSHQTSSTSQAARASTCNAVCKRTTPMFLLIWCRKYWASHVTTSWERRNSLDTLSLLV